MAMVLLRSASSGYYLNSVLWLHKRLMRAVAFVKNALVSPTSLRARIMRGSFWSFIGSTISYGTAFAAGLAAAQILGKSGFGELSMIRNTISTIGIFAGLGLGLTATKHVAEYREKAPERTARIIRLCQLTALVSGVVMTLVLAIGSSFIATTLLAAPHLASSLIIGSLLLFIYSYDGTQKGILAGFEAYRRTAAILAIGGLLTLVSVITGTYVWGVNGALMGFLVSASTVLFLNSYAIRVERRQNKIPGEVKGAWTEKKVLVDFSLPALFSGLIMGVSIWIVNMMLVNQPNGYEQMGIIGATNYITTFAMFVPNAALQAFLPILSMELNRDVYVQTSRRLLILNSYTAFFFTTSFVAIMLYFVPAIMHLFGTDFGDGRIALVFALCALPVLTYKDGIARFIQAKSLLWFAFMSNLVWAIILIFSAQMLIDYGASGITLALLCSYILNSMIFVPIYYRKLNMNRQIWRDASLGAILALSLLPAAFSNFVSLNFSFLSLLFIVTICGICIAALLIWKWFQE